MRLILNVYPDRSIKVIDKDHPDGVWLSEYHIDSVDKAIATSRQPIGKAEAKKIHALLKGHKNA